MIRIPVLCLGLATAVAATFSAKAEDAPNQVCCAFNATLRIVSDELHYGQSPLLPPGARGSDTNQTQARLELSAYGPVDQPEAPLSWSLRGYVRTDKPLGLRDTESPAFLKMRQATVSVPVLEGDITFGRIVLGSSTMRLRNLVDYLDNISVETERRSDFLPDRLDNRIGQVGVQLSQAIDSVGALRLLVVPKISGLSDSNYERLSLLRFAPDLRGSPASLEALWFWSDQRTALGTQGALPLSSSVQIYGEISHELRWPQLNANLQAVELRRVTATLAGVGIEYRPDSDWTFSLETMHNNRPVSADAFSASQQYLSTARLLAAQSVSGTLSGLPYGYQQPWYVGTLAQYQPAGGKLTVALSYYRGLRDGSSVATFQAKLGLSKHVEVSLFARSANARRGQEFQFTPEATRYGLAFNWVK